jgi:hypothetical protein
LVVVREYESVDWMVLFVAALLAALKAWIKVECLVAQRDETKVEM